MAGTYFGKAILNYSCDSESIQSEEKAKAHQDI
jgi:hypothetical protein